MKRLAILLFIAATPLFSQPALVLEGATMIDGVAKRPVPDAVVIIQHGVVTGVGRRESVIIPRNARRLDLRGKYIMPGLIDGHIHYGGERDLLQLLAWGVTSANCMFESVREGRAMELRTQPDTARAPRIFAAAPIFTTRHGWWADGVPSDSLPADSGINRFPATPDEAREAVRAAKALGIGRIKVMYDSMAWCRDPLPALRRMDPAVMRALIGEAAAQHLISEVHAPTFGDAVAAQDAGVTAFVHGVIDQRVDAQFTSNLQGGPEFYMPTFSLYEFLADPPGFIDTVLADPRFRASLSPDRIAAITDTAYAARYHARYPNAAFVRERLPITRENFMTVVRNYASVALGTDMWVFPGIAAHVELEEMVKAGLTPMQAISAGTVFTGQFIGVTERVGGIYIGGRGDILILDADPSADIRNTRSVSTIIKGGRIYSHDELVRDSMR